MEKKKLYLLGAGGHCMSSIDVIDSTSQYQIMGVFDYSKESIGKKVLNHEIIDIDKNIEKYISNDSFFIVTVGQIKSASTRERLFQKLKNLKANIPTIISSKAYVSKNAKVGEGTMVFHGAIINADAEVGGNCIINSKALIEHSSEVGDHCHISTAAVVNGDCRIGHSSFIGSNSVLEQGLVVKSHSLLSAGLFHRIKR